LRVVKKADHHDVAQITVAARIPVQLAIGTEVGLTVGSSITLLGFPNYHVGDGVAVARGPIIQERKYSFVKHFVIQPLIVKGNSGGPIIDDQARTVGIAVKGLGTPGHFSEFDELSSFVPVTALKEMK